MLKSKTYLKSTPYLTFNQFEIFSGSVRRWSGSIATYYNLTKNFIYIRIWTEIRKSGKSLSKNLSNTWTLKQINDIKFEIVMPN